MILKKSSVILTTVIIFLTSSVAYSDTVHLKNGDIITGELLTLVDGLCVFKTRYGVAISMHSYELEKLTTDDVYEFTLFSGEKIQGKLISENNEKTGLFSESFGLLSIDPSEIQSAIKITLNTKKVKGESEQSFGEEEDQEPPLNFLSGSTVLLSPGIYEVEFGYLYKSSREETSLINVGYFQRSAYKARQSEFSLTTRGGIMDKMEGWVDISGTYTYIEQVSTNDWVRHTNAWDIGDIGLGIQYLILPESKKAPAVSILGSVNIPTGQKKYYDITSTWKDPLNNGSGHWVASLGMSFTRTVDPVILFGGVTYNYSFERNIDGYDVDERWSIYSYMGLGFAVNEKLSLGSRFAWGYSKTMVVDDQEIFGSDSEPMDLSFSASYRAFDNYVVTPQTTFALNDDAGVSAFSLKISRKF